MRLTRSLFVSLLLFLPMGCTRGPLATLGVISAPPAGTTTNTSLGPAAGKTQETLASLYTVGRTWGYRTTLGGALMTGLTGSAAPLTFDTTTRVNSISGHEASVTETISPPLLPGAPASDTFDVDLTATNPLAVRSVQGAGVQYHFDIGQATDASITVPAGTFAAKHVSGTLAVSVSASGTPTVNGNSTFEAWYSSSVGVIKEISSTVVALPSPPPGDVSPADASLLGQPITTTVELTRFK